MTLINFRGHKSLKIEFGAQTTISGDNRLGKSTVFDSFVWLLFGKDQFDRKDFQIIPIIEGKELERVDPEVTATIDVEGRTMTLKRVLHQKWVRRRGTSEEVFDGCDTLYYFNDVPLKASEYKARVDMIIEETLFKLITNPAQFLSLHWTKQREYLFQMAGTISDREIADRDPRFSQLLDMINGKSLVEFKKEISARKKKLKDDLDNIQPRIDQTSRLMPAEQDWSKIQADIAEVEKEINLIDAILGNEAKANRAKYEGIQGLQADINNLKTKQQEAIHAAKTAAQQEAFEANQKVREDQQKIADFLSSVTEKLRRLQQAEAEREQALRGVDTLKNKLKSEEAEIVKLRADWDAENAKEYEAKTGCLTCPAFGHECADPIALEKHEQQADKARDTFMQAKDRKLEEITKSGVEKKESINHLTKRIADGESYVTEATEKVATLTAEHQQAVEAAKADTVEVKTVAPREVIASELPVWQECEQRIREIEAEIQKNELGNPASDTSEYTAKKAELNAKRDTLKNELQKREFISTYKAEIKRLEEEGSNLAQQIADLENQEFTIADFTRARIEEADRRINGMFQIVRFKLFDRTNDGNEFEACIATNAAGVPIAVTNTAEQINAGLDIINTLSHFYNVSAPIFADGAESVNSYLKTPAQMIFLRVTTEKVLTISNN